MLPIAEPSNTNDRERRSFARHEFDSAALEDVYTIGIRLRDLSKPKREQLPALMEELEEAERRESGANLEPRAGAL